MNLCHSQYGSIEEERRELKGRAFHPVHAPRDGFVSSANGTKQ